MQYVWVEDLADLKDLDVYGNFLRAFGLRIEATLSDMARILKDLGTLNVALFNLYITYVLAKAGYSYKPLVLDEDLRLETVNFGPEDWVKNWALFSKDPAESWSSAFRNAKNENLTIVCLNLKLQGQADSPRMRAPMNVWFGISEANTGQLAKDHKEGRADFVVVHPAICRVAKDAFRETKLEMQKLCTKDVFLSAGEFRSQMLQSQDLSEVEEGWTRLLHELESEFVKAWPLLAFSENRELLRRAEEELQQASREFEVANDTNANGTNCVRDAGYACESLLAVIYQSHRGSVSGSGKKLTFDDYLSAMSREIEEDFGKHTLEDLHYIRDMRNQHVHPGAPRATREDAFRVYRRAQMLFDHFKLNESAERNRPMTRSVPNEVTSTVEKQRPR